MDLFLFWAAVAFVAARTGYGWLSAVVAAVYVVWAYTHPWHDCWACKGTGRNAFSTNRRRGKCWRCRGRGELRTLGSRLMRRMVKSGRDSWRGRKGK